MVPTEEKRERAGEEDGEERGAELRRNKGNMEEKEGRR